MYKNIIQAFNYLQFLYLFWLKEIRRKFASKMMVKWTIVDTLN